MNIRKGLIIKVRACHSWNCTLLSFPNLWKEVGKNKEETQKHSTITKHFHQLYYRNGTNREIYIYISLKTSRLLPPVQVHQVPRSPATQQLDLPKLWSQRLFGHKTKRRHRIYLPSSPCMSPLKSIWVFPKTGVPQNGCFIMENPIKMDDLGEKTHYFRKHPYKPSQQVESQRGHGFLQQHSDLFKPWCFKSMLHFGNQLQRKTFN